MGNTMKQHHTQAIWALVCCCLSANLLVNYAQQKLIQEDIPVNDSLTLAKIHTPKLVWLMSFPNSGTSYTLREVEQLSNYSMASNYGKSERSKLVYEDIPQGPVCRSQSDKWPRPLPKEYVLAKTHCTGYAKNDGAAALKRKREDFIKGCATTRQGQYDPSLVHKTIHLVRNPFHNLISRFNCEHKLKADEGDFTFAKKYPRDVEGFHGFCRDLDADFDKQYSKNVFPENKRPDVKKTRCHDDIISYVQWHNLAFETSRELHLPTMLIHYEDYEEDQSMTFSNILDFLHLEEKGKADKFSARHDYHEYFTNEDRQNVKKLVKQLASDHTWKAVERYFDDVETE